MDQEKDGLHQIIQVFFQVRCGEWPDITDPDEKEALDSMVFVADNGNIIIKAF